MYHVDDSQTWTRPREWGHVRTTRRMVLTFTRLRLEDAEFFAAHKRHTKFTGEGGCTSTHDQAHFMQLTFEFDLGSGWFWEQNGRFFYFFSFRDDFGRHRPSDGVFPFRQAARDGH